jgi:hypothetical protein
MGEKIKTLSKGKFLDNNFEIELNHPASIGQGRQIHIQTKKFRLEMDEKDYLKYAFSILLAEMNLKKLKRLK